MNKEQVLELMNAIPPDLLEEAGVQAPARRPLPRLVRTGLIAACLCAAVVGTAFAAANPEAVANLIRRFAPVQSETVTMPDGAQGHHITFEPAGYPMERFSFALLAAGEGREDWDVILEFDTWEETRAFIGEDIPCVMPDFATDQGEHFRVDLSYDSQDRLTYVGVGTYGSVPAVELTIMTEHCRGDARGLWHRVMTGGPDTKVELLAPYQMANGCQAQITLLTDPLPVPDSADVTAVTHCSASFICDGILYNVFTGGDSRWSREELLAPLYEALDSFP